MKDLHIERERHANNVKKLNPPVFEYDPIEQPYCPHWLRQLDKSGNITAVSLREVIIAGAVIAIIAIAWCNSDMINHVLTGGRQ